MEILKPKNVANLLAITVKTLQTWDNTKKLIAFRTPSNRRYYTRDQINTFLNIKQKINKYVIGYCRVSSKKQQDDLDRQITNVTTYLLAQGTCFKIISDIGSGINYNKKGLKELLALIVDKQVSKIVVLYKDRLLRFGFELIENLCTLYDTKIEIIDNTIETKEQELITDMIQIITVFSARLQGSRSKKTKQILKELKNVAN